VIEKKFQNELTIILSDQLKKIASNQVPHYIQQTNQSSDSSMCVFKFHASFSPVSDIVPSLKFKIKFFLTFHPYSSRENIHHTRIILTKQKKEQGRGIEILVDLPPLLPQREHPSYQNNPT